MTSIDYVISITDGTTTKTLTSSPFQIRKYLPNPPTKLDGLNDNSTVSETIEIELTDGTTIANNNEIRDIEGLLNQAVLAQSNQNVSRVYLNMKNSAAESTYQSEILDGYVDRDEETLRTGYWDSDVQVAIIHITRRYYFETTSDVTIALDNPLGTAVTTGLKIYNPCVTRTINTIAFVSATKKITDSGNGLIDFKTGDTIQVVNSISNDGTYTIATGGVAGEIVTNEALADEGTGTTITIIGPNINYVEIPAAQISTVIDAPIKLEITNALGLGITYKDFYIGLTNAPGIDNMVWFYEGETATDGSGVDSTTNTESYLCSGGFYNAIVWSGDTEKELAKWTLTEAMLEACNGNNFRVLARLQGGTIAATLQFRLSIKYSTITLWSGELINAKTDDYKQDLGTIQLPPQLLRQVDISDLTLALTCKQSGGGTLNLDFIEIFPIDSFRALRNLGLSVPNGDTIVIDDITQPNQLYNLDGSSKKYPMWVERGSQLIVKNNTKHQIQIISDQNISWYTFIKTTVKAYYRPRRLTL